MTAEIPESSEVSRGEQEETLLQTDWGMHTRVSKNQMLRAIVLMSLAEDDDDRDELYDDALDFLQLALESKDARERAEQLHRTQQTAEDIYRGDETPTLDTTL